MHWATQVDRVQRRLAGGAKRERLLDGGSDGPARPRREAEALAVTSMFWAM